MQQMNGLSHAYSTHVHEYLCITMPVRADNMWLLYFKLCLISISSLPLDLATYSYSSFNYILISRKMALS